MSNKESISKSKETIITNLSRFITEKQKTDIDRYFKSLIDGDNSNENNGSIRFNFNKDGTSSEITISKDDRDSNMFIVVINRKKTDKHDTSSRRQLIVKSGILFFIEDMNSYKIDSKVLKDFVSIELKDAREYSKEEKELLKELMSDYSSAIFAIESSRIFSRFFSLISEQYDSNKLTNREKVQFYIDSNGKFNFCDEFFLITLNIIDKSADIEIKDELKDISEIVKGIEVIKRRIDIAEKHGIDVSKAKEKLKLLTPTFPGSDGEIGDQGAENLSKKRSETRSSR